MTDFLTRKREPRLSSTRVATAPVLTSNAVPEVTQPPPPDRGAEFTFGSFADGLQALSDNVLFPALSEQRADEGAREAHRDREAGQFERRNAFSIRDQAYNRAGLTAMAADVGTSSTRRIMEMSREHAGDPSGFERSFQSYRAGVIQEVELQSPELATELGQRMDRTAMSYLERIGQQRANIVRDKSEASLIQYDAQLDALLDDVSGDLFSANPELSGAAMIQLEGLASEYLAEMDRVGPDGLPVYTEVQRTQARQEFFARAVEEGAVKWLRETDDIAGAAMSFLDGDLRLTMGDGTEIDVSASLSPTARQRVLRAAEREMSNRNSARTELERQQEAALKERQDLARYNMTLGILSGEMTQAEIAQAVQDRQISANDGEKLAKALDARGRQPRATDEMAQRIVIQSLYGDGEDPSNFILENFELFAPGDAERYLKAAAAMHGRDGEGLNPDQKFYMDRLTQSLKRKGPLADLDAGEQMRIAAAMDEAFQRMQAGEDPREVYLDLQQRAQSSLELFGDPTESLVRPRFAVMGADGSVDIAATASALEANKSQMPPDLYAQQRALILEWHKAQQLMTRGGTQ